MFPKRRGVLIRRRKANCMALVLAVIIMVPVMVYGGHAYITAQSSINYDSKWQPWEEEIVDSNCFDTQSFLLDREMILNRDGVEGWKKYFVDHWHFYFLVNKSAQGKVRIPESLVKEVIKKWGSIEDNLRKDYQKVIKNPSYKDISWEEFIIIYDRACRDKKAYTPPKAKGFLEKLFSIEDNPFDPEWLRKYNSIGRAIRDAGNKISPLPQAPALTGGM